MSKCDKCGLDVESVEAKYIAQVADVIRRGGYDLQAERALADKLAEALKCAPQIHTIRQVLEEHAAARGKV